MRDPDSKNPRQNSIYIQPSDWEAAREMARLRGQSISAFIVMLVRREKWRVLGKEKKP